MYSYSIYIWHQIIIAFYRYCINGNVGVIGYVVCILLTLLIGAFSYFAIEKRMSVIFKKKTALLLCICLSVLVAGSGLYVYLKAGVMRDVPELNVSASDIHRGMHSEYNARVYAMDTEFSDDDRIKILAVGDSFVRDWCNVLMESDVAERIDISYVYGSSIDESFAGRISKADYIFVNGSTVCENKIPECIINNMKNEAELWGVGTKCFGVSNGNIYNRRYREDYFQLTAPYDDVKEQYNKELELCGEHYIDFINPVLQENGEVRVFTDTGKFISQDCRHLTQAGAQYYAKILNFEDIFHEKNK
ncbi:MAG: hypothetical protein NC433_07660 [Clostridiales bacterium]|nr:hypothetical protein [Clostridiales bacterium]